MYYLKNDYSEGCHPRILDALQKTNLEATTGYGLDEYCSSAADRIKAAFSCPDADVHFLVGGTQANLSMISHTLRNFEAVMTVTTGHIAVHEGSSIEATGHEVLLYPNPEGKVTPEMVEQALLDNPDEHTAVVGMVYISNATEIGTVYTKAELMALHDCCQKHGLPLYMDGARLATALMSPASDLKPEDISSLTDAFYVGGTKNGAMFGEALVIVNPRLKARFRNTMKQKGAMLAKGRLLGIQFDELFRDNLWFDLAAHANSLAQKLQKSLVEKGVPMMVSSPSNQIFPIFSQEDVTRLSEDFAFEIWGSNPDGTITIRLVTSWATEEAVVDAFLGAV